MDGLLQPASLAAITAFGTPRYPSAPH